MDEGVDELDYFIPHKVVGEVGGHLLDDLELVEVGLAVDEVLGVNE